MKSTGDIKSLLWTSVGTHALLDLDRSASEDGVRRRRAELAQGTWPSLTA